MDNNNFVIKNSILLTICCFIILNLRNIVLFKFIDDNNVGFSGFFYTFTILSIFTIIALGIKYYLTDGNDIVDAVNEVFKVIHGKDNYIPTIKKTGLSLGGVDIMNLLLLFFPFFFIIMGSVNGGYATKKRKNNLNFTPIRSAVLGIFMLSVMILFFQIIFISIVNNVTKTQLNTNFNLYVFLFLFLLFLYSVFYCYYVDQQKNDKDNNNNNKV